VRRAKRKAVDITSDEPSKDRSSAEARPAEECQSNEAEIEEKEDTA
jgi:hypothetical protein